MTHIKEWRPWIEHKVDTVKEKSGILLAEGNQRSHMPPPMARWKNSLTVWPRGCIQWMQKDAESMQLMDTANQHIGIIHMVEAMICRVHMVDMRGKNVHVVDML